MGVKHQAKRVVGKARRTKHAIKQRLSVGNNYYFSIDNPRKKVLDSTTLEVDGWIIPKNNVSFTLRVKNNGAIYPVELGLKRLDVVKAHPDKDPEKALHSGFRAQFEFENGDLVIELDEGSGFKTLYSTSVTYGVELLPKDLYNKELSNNYPEHLNLIDNRKKIYYEDAIDHGYVREADDPRLMAIYLPQFHPFAENNKAWGQGFTEWSNVTTGQPRFVGHQQPILPKDLGFYDLRLESKLKEQIDLAKRYGVHGFCFYYYWFSGKRLMEGPLETLVNNKAWDFNFAICWANENWTKRWDGRDNDVIIAQEYRESDPLDFIKDVEHILMDDRYIREGGKPVLMVYRASELKEPAKYAKVWREYFHKKHKTELQLVSYLSFDDQDPRDYGFDAALDFAPLSAFFKNHLFENNQFPYLDVSTKLLDPNFSGVVADYRTIAKNSKLSSAYDFPVYPCLTPSWDNDARKKGKGFIYQNSSPDLYAAWLDRLIKQENAKKKKAPLIFVNAWNEWAEGAIMEPSMHMGHAVLNRTAETVLANRRAKTSYNPYGLSKRKDVKLAVIVHLFYPDLWPTIKARLANIEEPYDLFVTLNEKDRHFAPTVDQAGVNINTFVVPNRGRDVLPFLYVLRRVSTLGYTHLLKIHSKKSKHRDDGSSWFEGVLEGLLPNHQIVSEVVKKLGEPETGVIGPAGHFVSLKRHMGSNRPILKHMLSRMYNREVVDNVLDRPEMYRYVGGTMFWARVDCLKELLDLQLLPDDFQSEHAQVDGTTAHAIERLIGVTVLLNNRNTYEVDKTKIQAVSKDAYDEKYRFAP